MYCVPFFGVFLNHLNDCSIHSSPRIQYTQKYVTLGSRLHVYIVNILL